MLNFILYYSKPLLLAQGRWPPGPAREESGKYFSGQRPETVLNIKYEILSAFILIIGWPEIDPLFDPKRCPKSDHFRIPKNSISLMICLINGEIMVPKRDQFWGPKVTSFWIKFWTLIFIIGFLLFSPGRQLPGPAGQSNGEKYFSSARGPRQY